MNLRMSVQSLIDKSQFWFDVFPGLYYQPLPSIGLDKARRGEGTKERWRAIEGSLNGCSIESAMDIGCNVGYFCFSLAAKGIPTLGIDVDERALRIARYAARKMEVPDVGWCNMVINTETVSLLPKTDLILVLSVWHHWVKLYGFETASDILSAVWGKCSKVLFFETGEAEMPTEFALPDMGSSPEHWLTSYLASTCADSRVECLGLSKAFGAGGDENQNVVYRHLFKLVRVGPFLEQIWGAIEP